MKRPALLAATLLFPVLAHAADKPFDPMRNPAQDLLAAEQQAAREHKNILLDVGGNWCPWCLVLDRTLAGDAGLHEALEENYVVLHVNWSRENKNEAFLAKFPKPNGYPAWSTHTLGDGYNKQTLSRFLSHYAPAR
jgi:thiol:disulfide interchange protein